MGEKKQLFITGFALFSMFFGAGNLLLPPFLGFRAGNDWIWVTLGFVIVAVFIPILGILAHARLQGTMYDFAKKVSPAFSYVYCILVYMISVAIPSPRTASATHEIAIHPFLGTEPLLTSSIYFALVLVFVLNRTRILNIIGKFLTPLIAITLLLVIVIGLVAAQITMNPSAFDAPVVTGLLEGYQTFDAIGAVVVGGVIIISLNLKGIDSYEVKRRLIGKSGLIAGSGLLIIYTGLIAVGAFYGTEIFIDKTLSNDMQRATLLTGISTAALGNIGSTILNLLIALACFTTAVGIVTGTADYFKGLFKNTPQAYTIAAVLACLIGIVVGQLDFHSIIVIGLPILMFIYPVTIMLIFLNILPEKYTDTVVFRSVVITAIVFSIPDILGTLGMDVSAVKNIIPLGNYSLGWLIPSFVMLLMIILYRKPKHS